MFFSLRWCLSIALRIPTAHDFRVISVRKWARVRTQRKNFPQAKLHSEINVCFLLNEHGNLFFYCIILVHILSPLIKKKIKKIIGR